MRREEDWGSTVVQGALKGRLGEDTLVGLEAFRIAGRRSHGQHRGSVRTIAMYRNTDSDDLAPAPNQSLSRAFRRQCLWLDFL
jgi:hypothetical protein